jgi:phosphocarrier protein HPr
MMNWTFHNREPSVIRSADAGCDMTSETPLRRDVTVNLENGLHLVPCSRIAEFVRDYPGTVSIRSQDQLVDAKSIFDLLTLRAVGGTVLTLEVTGVDSVRVVEGLVALFERNFEPE